MKSIRGRALSALLVMAIGGLAAGCGDDDDPGGGGGAAAPSGKPLSIALQAEYSAFPVFVAKDQGFMRKHGVSDIKIVKFTSLPAMTTAISRGQVDMGLHTPLLVHTVNQQAKSSPLKFFAPIQRAQMAWSARQGSSIPAATTDDWQSTIRAWQGKKIGAQPGGLIEAMTKKFGDLVGLKAGKDFEIVNVGVGPQQLSALKAGIADVASGDAFGAVQIDQAGAGQTIINFLQQNVPPAYRGEMMSAGFFAPEAAIQQQRELYAGFHAALAEARAFIADPANRAKVEESLVKNIKVTPAIAKRLYEQMGGFDIDLSRETIDRTVQIFVESGLFKAPGPSYADLVTEVGKT